MKAVQFLLCPAAFLKEGLENVENQMGSLVTGALLQLPYSPLIAFPPCFPTHHAQAENNGSEPKRDTVVTDFEVKEASLGKSTFQTRDLAMFPNSKLGGSALSIEQIIKKII